MVVCPRSWARTAVSVLSLGPRPRSQALRRLRSWKTAFKWPILNIFEQNTMKLLLKSDQKLMNLNMSNHIKSVHDKMRIYCFWEYLNQILVDFCMSDFTTNLRTFRPYQDRPFAPERWQDRSLKNPKTLDRLVFKHCFVLSYIVVLPYILLTRVKEGMVGAKCWE